MKTVQDNYFKTIQDIDAPIQTLKNKYPSTVGKNCVDPLFGAADNLKLHA